MWFHSFHVMGYQFKVFMPFSFAILLSMTHSTSNLPPTRTTRCDNLQEWLSLVLVLVLVLRNPLPTALIGGVVKGKVSTLAAVAGDQLLSC